MRTIIRIKKIITKTVRTKLGSTKIIFIDRYALIFRETFMILLYNFIQSAIQTKKMKNVMKEKLNSLVEERGRINSKQK